MDLPLRSDRPFAKLFHILVPALCGILLTGCGSENEQAAAPAPQPEQVVTAQPESTDAQPTEVVSQFLDRVRRGGEESRASELLTKLAQQEMTRIGRPLQFPGSPDTRFEITQSYPIPDQENAIWVHSYLSDPTESGDPIQYEVVWTLKRDTDGWRISGFTTDPGEGLDPLEIDFEDGDRLARMLAPTPAETTSETTLR